MLSIVADYIHGCRAGRPLIEWSRYRRIKCGTNPNEGHYCNLFKVLARLTFVRRERSRPNPVNEWKNVLTFQIPERRRAG